MYDAMKRILVSLLLSGLSLSVHAQDAGTKLSQAFKLFEADAQMKSGIASLYVQDAKTGKVVFEKNATIGLAPASTQKIITSATAYELLGKDFRYRTEIRYDGNIENGIAGGNFYIVASGDPTFGSWRYPSTTERSVLSLSTKAFSLLNIRGIDGMIYLDLSGFGTHTVPGGWMWEDIGNYYGAGSGGLNWRENQYDLFMESGEKIGSDVVIKKTVPAIADVQFLPELKAAAKGTGDNAYIYLPPYGSRAYVRGTIPVSESNFKISGSIPNPPKQFFKDFLDSLSSSVKFDRSRTGIHYGGSLPIDNIRKNAKLVYTHESPVLDSIIFWFNRRSINLYGEALLHTFSFNKTGSASTEQGTDLVMEFWKSKGIGETELNIVDGSGLSPLNRVTTKAQVNILQYARKQPWFNGFFLSLPEFNGMKMKSGTIRGAKAFTGYHTSRSGHEYVFSFIVNNYNGQPGALVQKMYKVLDALK